MTAPTEQFSDIAKRSQEAVSAAVRTWSDALQGFAGNISGVAPKLPDAQAFVDQYFDFAQKVLENQRAFTQSVLSAGTQAAESVTEQASKVAENVKAQTLQATEKATESVTAQARNARAAAAKN